jgi:hypothetical protein
LTADATAFRLFPMDSAFRERVDRMRRLRESYEEWHRLGIAALERLDFPSVADAIQAEATIICEHERVSRSLKDPA